MHGLMHVAQEGFFRMAPESYFRQLPLIEGFQAALALEPPKAATGGPTPPPPIRERHHPHSVGHPTHRTDFPKRDNSFRMPSTHPPTTGWPAPPAGKGPEAKTA